MIKGHEAGAGAVVTKTIRLGAAINPVHHMGTVNQDSLISCEKWADSDRLNWYENEIPKTVAAEPSGVVPFIYTAKRPRPL